MHLCCPGATIISVCGTVKAGLWLIISFKGQCSGSFAGCLFSGSGVDVLNLLFGGVLIVDKSSAEEYYLLI